MMELDELEAMLRASLATADELILIGLEQVGQLAATLAAHYPGEYQEGWPLLAQATLEDKASKGFPVPSPLKRTGEMAESYQSELVPAELAVVVGSPELKALWHELGTVKMPPRPVVSLAVKNTLPHAADVFGEIAVSMLTGKRR